MRIDAIFPSYYFNTGPAAALPRETAIPTGTVPAPQQNSLYYPEITVDISPEGWDMYNRNVAGKDLVQGEETAKKSGLPDIPVLIPAGGGQNKGAQGINDVFEVHECQTCKNRKYQDSSSDPSVSFQSPTHLSPGLAAGAVASHESEHVAHEQARAEKEDRKIVSQSVTIHTSICPECGRVYVSGGVTRTVTANKQDFSPQEGGGELALINPSP